MEAVVVVVPAAVVVAMEAVDTVAVDTVAMVVAVVVVEREQEADSSVDAIVATRRMAMMVRALRAVCPHRDSTAFRRPM